MFIKLDILLKCVLLLYRENELKRENEEYLESSGDLIKSILNMYKNRKMLFTSESSVTDNLKQLVIEMVNNPENFDSTMLIHQLDTILKDKESELASITKQIETEISPQGMKRSVVTLRNSLTNHYKELEFGRLISTTMMKLKNNELEGSVQEYTSSLIDQLESLTIKSTSKDPGIVDELDITDTDMDRVFKKVKSQDEGCRLKTGWKELNEMLGGGFRYGEMALTSGIQHAYKSGFLRSLFAQLCMYNKPVMKDPNKKPLALFISFEDDSEVILKFFYHYLYFTENNATPDTTNLDTKEASEYLKDRLSKNGFNVKIIRVDPTEWTYTHLVNKLLNYEAAGYELHFLVIDYLSKLPTTGCNRTGAMGTDIRDLFDRVRNYNSARSTLVITAQQLNVEVKQLLKNGISDKNLVKEIAGKGYYEGSKQIDQVVDLEIHHHIAKVGNGYVLTFQRGKRRYPEVIPDSKKYFMLPFPKQDPVIPPNIDLEGNYVGFKYGEENTILDTIDGFNL